jgi:predicted amidohydrolase
MIAAAPVTLHAATPGGWTGKAPRSEISPGFRRDGPVFIIEDKAGNPGVQGHWETTLPVKGGVHHRFSVLRRASESIEHPRRSCVVRIEWQNEKGAAVTSPHPVNPAYFGKTSDLARPEFPRDQGPPDSEGWVAVADTWLAPAEATRAVVKLQLRWAPGGKVEWKNPILDPVAPPEPRTVTLAAVHLNVSGNKTAMENCSAFAPLVAEAADKGADLVVLPEFLPCKGVTSDYATAAEPVPGPSSNFFASLARKHDLYIVFSLAERDGPLIHNTAVLLAPDGKLAGKYRKVTLPREEIERGITPGDAYPVFDTRFGKLGMMICYDVFFPEVARELAVNGAEVIALPIWGGNPSLARARCAENGGFLVTSTYTDHKHDWMKTAIWNREGDRLAEAKEWGQVVTAEVDLARRTYWSYIGDFQARIAREAPVRKAE